MNVMKYNGRYKSVMMKTELKDAMDEMIGKMGKKMTYSELIWELLKRYKNEK